MTLTVEADGYAPDLKQVTVGDDLGLVEFKLGESHPLRARVVDHKGNPIAGVTVVADTWRNKRTLDWRSDTDDDGYFEWPSAPADVVKFDVLKEGYMATRHAELTGGIADQTVILRPELVIKGIVVNAKTGQPIPKFREIRGWQYSESGTPFWDRQNVGKFVDGKYETHLSEPVAMAYIRIEADDCAPAVSREIKPDEGMDAPVVLDFKLQPAESIRVAVLKPDGTPAAGAKAVVASKGQRVRVTDGQFAPNTVQESVTSTAGSDGVVTFPAQDENTVVVVVADSGYAILTFDELKKLSGKQIPLTPWSKVEVTFKVGSKSFAGEPVYASTSLKPSLPNIYIILEAYGNTDSAGRAVFDKMAAGPGYVQDWKMRDNGMWGGVVRADYTAKAGETIHVQAGGVGRPVIGWLIASEDYKGKPDWSHNANGQLTTIDTDRLMRRPPALPYPAEWAKMSFDARRAWWQSPAIVNWQRPTVPVRSYTAIFESGGRFRINNVPAGNYQLNVTLVDPTNNGSSGPQDYISSTQTVVIAPMPGGQTDEPLDVGPVTLSKPKPVVPQPHPSTAPAPEPGSPGDIDRRYRLALDKGDSEAALACVDTSHPRVESAVRSMAPAATATHHMFDAAVATLGEDGAKKLTGLHPGQTYSTPIPNYSWEITGDRAIPVGPSAPYNGQTMVRINGQWKINAGERFVLYAESDDEMNKEIATYLAKLTAMTDAIKSGKVKTPEQFRAMMQGR